MQNCVRFDGARLKARREEKGLTLRQLTDSLVRHGISITFQTLFLYEAGQVRAPGYGNILALAQVLDVNPDYFFGPGQGKAPSARSEATSRPAKAPAPSSGAKSRKTRQKRPVRARGGKA